jgi:hypothetical protein
VEKGWAKADEASLEWKYYIKHHPPLSLTTVRERHAKPNTLLCSSPVLPMIVSHNLADIFVPTLLYREIGRKGPAPSKKKITFFILDDG